MTVIFAAVVALLLGVPVAAQAQDLRQDIHITTDPDDGETMVLLRFPLALAFPTQPNEQQPFLTISDGAPHLDQTAYEDDFDGFVAHLLAGYRFGANGQKATPSLGALSLVPTKGALMPPMGYATTLSLLDICTAFPGAESITDLEVALLVYLDDTQPQDTISIEWTGNPHTGLTLTDHRGETAMVQRYASAPADPITVPGGKPGLLQRLHALLTLN